MSIELSQKHLKPDCLLYVYEKNKDYLRRAFGVPYLEGGLKIIKKRFIQTFLKPFWVTL